MKNWKEKLTELFSGLSQDPLEDAFELMDIEGTEEEKNSWLSIIDIAINAADKNDRSIIDVVNAGHGYIVNDPTEARDIFMELRNIYLSGLNNEKNT